MATIRDLAGREDLLTGGHRLCAGCGAGIAIRQVLLVSGKNVVCSIATGCAEVSTTIYPYTAWEVPLIHSAFENSAATISGVESAYRALKRRKKVDKELKFIAFGGDGGTFDIGFQSLSGALERGHQFLYVCYDNEAYMNTGIQRSSATPLGAWTTTTPVGKKIPGKPKWRKNLTWICGLHPDTYAAQASISHWRDFTKKVERALNHSGPSFINVLAPCPRGWRFKEDKTVEMARLAVETCYWPLFEIEEGKFKVNVKPREKKPVTEWLKPQGRFRHLLSEENSHLLKTFQKRVDEEWDYLNVLAGAFE